VVLRFWAQIADSLQLTLVALRAEGEEGEMLTKRASELSALRSPVVQRNAFGTFLAPFVATLQQCGFYY
jgi:hypothetical protein